MQNLNSEKNIRENAGKKKKIKKKCFWQEFSSNRLNIKRITLANQRKPQRSWSPISVQNPSERC